MEYEKIKVIADKILISITPYVEKIEIVGSIRRKKKDCRDIDIVILQKDDFMSINNLKNTLRKQAKRIILEGNKIFRFMDKNEIQVDVYFANKNNFEGILLLKTGSKEHNIKLCQEAIKKNWKMTDEGLITNEGIIKKEKEILEKVFGKYIEPENR